MRVCPDGHPSAATDYCDVCGSPLGAPPAPNLCPACGLPSAGRFCEECGHDSALSAPRAPEPSAPQPIIDPPSEESGDPVPVTEARLVDWVATITADPDFYERVLAREGPDADRVEFPAYVPQRRIVLRGGQILIGKRSLSQGVTPDIDLGLAPSDAGVSRAHAMLRLTPTALTITDLGSTNGTSLNGSDELIPPDTEIPLRSGDRIHLGAWTTITLSTEPR